MESPLPRYAFVMCLRSLSSPCPAIAVKLGAWEPYVLSLSSVMVFSRSARGAGFEWAV
ncbi:hypothetical protein E2C01_048712 [Portunus trituberculatus]|uniref:Uncharacterized protein n=1 Tax=Portunus trituberculatus TaxID=210409 RepID=A0A5B7GB96_PORTR|nr:hypothetical protein [Portunus trituberculatus]